MKREFSILLTAAVLLIGAQRAEAIGRYWFGGSFGYGQYTMDDVNDQIEAIDEALGPRFNPIEDGIRFGAELGLHITRQLAVSLHYERIGGDSKVVEQSVEVVMNVPANLYYASVDFDAITYQEAYFGVGVSGGMVSSAGSTEFSIPGLQRAISDIEGSGMYADGRVYMTLPIGDHAEVTPHVGYRYSKASLDVFEIGAVEGFTLPLDFLADGDLELDYTGLFGGIQLRVLFGDELE